MATKRRGNNPATASEAANPPSELASPVSDPEPDDESPSVPVDEDALASEQGRPELPVAELVASDGGLDAFKKILAVMPADSGIAFVLVPFCAREGRNNHNRFFPRSPSNRRSMHTNCPRISGLLRQVAV